MDSLEDHTVNEEVSAATLDPLIVSVPKGKKKKNKKNKGAQGECKLTVKNKDIVIEQHIDEGEAKLLELIEQAEENLSKPVREVEKHNPREYQVRMYRKALEENVILYLETGCGKTMVACLLIKELACRHREVNESFKAVFFAPTVCLVEQQTEVLKINTSLKVQNYYGAKGVDNWNSSKWEAELNANDVFVMTPQVLYDALSHAFLKLDSFALLIFDECHQAKRSHPYARIMRDYYHKLKDKKPKIFCMTASPVTKKGVTSMEDSAKQIQELECLLASKVYTVEEKIESIVPTAKQVLKYYTLSRNVFPLLLQAINDVRHRHEAYYIDQSSNTDFRDMGELAKKVCKKIKKLHACLDHCLNELGLWCAWECINCLLDRIPNDLENDEENSEALQQSKEQFLKEALKVFQTDNPESALERIHIDNIDDGLKAVEKGFITPKVLLLIKCLMEYENVEELRCIVFVERVITATVLSNVFNKIGCLSFLKCSFLSGVNASSDLTSRSHRKTLEEFKAGRINVLVATDVAEEGIDVQFCSLVIRFEIPKTVRSYIQSRGRARMPGSEYIIFLEQNNVKQEGQLQYLMQSEESMKGQTLKRTHCSDYIDTCEVKDMEYFVVESTGATVSMDSSVNLIYHFCAKLPGDKYYKPQPEFVYDMVREDTLFTCALTFPPNAPLKEMVGSPKRSRSLAKQSVCLDACRKLHEIGQLTDNLVPVLDVEKPIEEEVMNISRRNVAGAGTTKKKELHGITPNQAFIGNWITNSLDVSLHAYIICFDDCQEKDYYASFVLLLYAEIDEDIANTEFELYRETDRIIKARVHSAGKCCFDANQLQEAKTYHEFIFNAMFGKLIRRSKKNGKALHDCEMINLFTADGILDDTWNSSNMYLVLPLIPGKFSDDIPIDWEAIKSSVVAANRFTALHSIKENHCGRGTIGLSCGSRDLEKSLVHMACESKPYAELKDKAVLTIHTGRIYTVQEVLENMNANSAIEGLEITEGSNYASYADYFAEKYKVFLKFPEQPLLRVKHTHRIHSLLTQDICGSKQKKSGNKMLNVVELPPEVCICTGISNTVIRALYILPSFIQRFKALLMAGQLRHTIVKEMPQCISVKPSLIMEALTTMRCHENFSSEGLELLGDSFLKYAVTSYLYLVYSTKHEGQLSARRSRAICNESLHALAVKKGLPGYIRDEPFIVEHWCAPGMLSSEVVPCNCNLMNMEVKKLEKLLKDENQEQPQKDKNQDHKTYKIQEEEKKLATVFRIGKTCSKGHRWICSKTISDTVEALIGAFIVDGGAEFALKFMKWIGMEIEFDNTLYEDAKNKCTIPQRVVNGLNITALEEQLGYVFANKSLLVEALTHASYYDPRGGHCCYQRLEFLGDALLDFTITRQLFLAHPGLSPGKLSDLKSAAVNNECFARSVVKHNLQRYLRHSSSELLSQITRFARAFNKVPEHTKVFGWESVEGPKVLGDLLESIAGAMLVDSGFDLEKVWNVMERLLSPLVTLETLPLHPIRELHELCQEKKLSFSWNVQRKGKLSLATVRIEVDGDEIVQMGYDRLKKTARKHAAQKALSMLMQNGIYHSRRQNLTKTDVQSETIRECNSKALANGNETLGKRHRLSSDENVSKKGKILPDSERNQVGDKRALDSDGNGSIEKRHKQAFEENTSSLKCSQEVKPMDVVKLDEPKNKSSSCFSGSERGTVSTSEAKVSTNVDIVKLGECKNKHSSYINESEGGTVSTLEAKVSTNVDIVKLGESENKNSSYINGSERGTLNSSEANVNGKMVDLTRQSAEENLAPAKPAYPTATETSAKGLSKCTEISNLLAQLQQTSLPPELKTQVVNLLKTQCSNGVSKPSLQLQLDYHLLKKGMGRSCLNSFCVGHKWKGPVYKELKQVGKPPFQMFVFSVSVDGPLGHLECTSDPMAKKDQAKDNAAVKLLHLIAK